LYIIGNDNGWLEFQNLKEGEKTLQGHHQLQAYDVDAATGNLSNRRVLIDYTARDKPCSGPDGMVADSEGNIWLASRCEYRPGVQVLDPKGKVKETKSISLIADPVVARTLNVRLSRFKKDLELQSVVRAPKAEPAPAPPRRCDTRSDGQRRSWSCGRRGTGAGRPSRW